MSTFAERLKKERVKAKLTQEEVAEYLGITRPAYTQYETEKTQPSVETTAKLADLYKISIDYLVGRYKDGDAYAEKIIERIKQRKNKKQTL